MSVVIRDIDRKKKKLNEVLSVSKL